MGVYVKNLSLSTSTIFLINIIFGTSLYINTKVLINNLGDKSFYVYIFASLIIFPLIYVIAYMAEKNPGIGIYELISPIGKKISFSLTFAYSLSKIFAATISLLFGLEFFCFLFKLDKSFVYYFFTFIIFFFTWSIYKNYSLESIVQKSISIFKFIPILTIIIFSFFNLKTNSFYFKNFNFDFDLNLKTIESIFKSIPIIILSFSGFENIFAIATEIKNPKNSFKSVLMSFFSVFFIYFLYQGIVSKIIFNKKINVENGFSEIYSFILNKIHIPNHFINILMLTLSLSIIGGVYNTIYANSQNICKIFSKKINYSNSIFIIGLIIYLYGIFLGKNIIYTQQLSGLATISVYILVSLIFFIKNKNNFGIKNYFLKISILISVFFLVYSIIKSISVIGYLGYLIYFLMIIFGYFISFLI